MLPWELFHGSAGPFSLCRDRLGWGLRRVAINKRTAKREPNSLAHPSVPVIHFLAMGKGGKETAGCLRHGMGDGGLGSLESFHIPLIGVLCIARVCIFDLGHN